MYLLCEVVKSEIFLINRQIKAKQTENCINNKFLPQIFESMRTACSQDHALGLRVLKPGSAQSELGLAGDWGLGVR